MSGVSRYQQANKDSDLLGDFRSAALRGGEMTTDEDDAANVLQLEVVFNMEAYFAIRK
jgi:hypothetical protein